MLSGLGKVLFDSSFVMLQLCLWVRSWQSIWASMALTLESVDPSFFGHEVEHWTPCYNSHGLCQLRVALTGLWFSNYDLRFSLWSIIFTRFYDFLPWLMLSLHRTCFAKKLLWFLKCIDLNHDLLLHFNDLLNMFPNLINCTSWYLTLHCHY